MIKKSFFSVIIILCSLYLSTSPALAKVIMQEKGTITIPTSEIIDDDLFVGGENIDLGGSVTGSVFAGAGIFDFRGNIKGDLVLGSGKANLSGIIDGDLYLGAGDVVLTKVSVGGNVVLGAGNVTIDKDSKIGGSLIVGAGNIKNSAPIGRNAMIGAGNLYLDNKIGKEARLAGGNIELGPLTAINGNLVYALGEDKGTLNQDPASTVGGTISRYTPPVNAQKDLAKAKDDFAKFGAVASRGWLVVSFLGSLLIGFLLLRLFPKTSLALASLIQSKSTNSLGTGFLIVILSLPIFLVLAITILGLPLLGILIPLFFVCLHLAKLITSYALGRFIATQFSWSKMGVYAIFLLGLFVFYLLRSLPAIGWVASFLFTWAGLGAIWIYGRSHLKNL